MKRFRYRLASVLRVREIQQDQATAAFEEARRDRMRAEQVHAVALAACSAAPVGSTGPGVVMQARHDDGTRAAAWVRHTRVLVARAADVEARRRDALVDATARVRGLENLRDRLHDEHQHQALRAEDLATAELAASRRHATSDAASLRRQPTTDAASGRRHAISDAASLRRQHAERQFRAVSSTTTITTAGTRRGDSGTSRTGHESDRS